VIKKKLRIWSGWSLIKYNFVGIKRDIGGYGDKDREDSSE